jgi:hypothetical protein
MVPAPTPAPTPNPSPQATATIGSTAFLYTTALPLTTIWTPPAACSTQTPLLFAGECGSSYGSCSVYPEALITRTEYWEAWINLAYWTTGHSLVTASCAPPSSQAVVSFSYSPARGCPDGYNTASAYELSNSDYFAFCCPP